MQQKYPRTLHLTYSEKATSDDKIAPNDNHFIGRNVVVSLKHDGENTTIYSDKSHARSLNSDADSEDRRWIEALRISKIENKIPPNMRICGESLLYKHTCFYDNLESFFYVFSIWVNDLCLSYDETINICNDLGLVHCPIIYEGVYNKNLILDIFSKIDNHEGFVIRLADSYNIADFGISLNKFVSKDFVLPSEHWRYLPKEYNKLKNNKNAWEII